MYVCMDVCMAEVCMAEGPIQVGKVSGPSQRWFGSGLTKLLDFVEPLTTLGTVNSATLGAVNSPRRAWR
jgi:hypothetical protein